MNDVSYDLVKMLLNRREIKVIHEYDDTRLVDDILETVSELLEDFLDSTGEADYQRELLADRQQDIKTMEKHIRKLERMLTSRNIGFKSWDEVS